MFIYTEENKLKKIVFIILGLLSFAVFYNYVYFFVRNYYINRKNLLSYLKTNDLKLKEKGEFNYTRYFYFDLGNEIELTCFLTLERGLLYNIYDTKNEKVLVSNFSDGFSDLKNYYAIQKIIFDKIITL